MRADNKKVRTSAELFAVKGENRGITVKIKKLILIVGVFVMTVALSSCGYNYEKAYEKTEALSSYEMEVSTIVTVNTPDSVKQTEVTQTIEVYKEGDAKMRYMVKTESASINEDGHREAESVSEYTYYDGKYYISMPGVKYASGTDFDSALKNITDLTGLISLPYEKMYNVDSCKVDGKMVYSYDVDGEDISEHVLSLLQSAADSVGEVGFAAKNISASASVKGGYVTDRAFEANYEAEDISFTVEIYTKLVNKRARVNVPDASKYASIE